MDSVTIKNFRCFGTEQTARIAPLTIFMGDNGTGKSTALAAIRSLWDACFARGMPDLQEFPHGFGPHASIPHHSRHTEGLVPVVGCGIQPESFDGADPEADPFRIRMEFGRCGFGTSVLERRISQGDHFISFPGDADLSSPTAIFGIGDRTWRVYDGTQDGEAAFVRDAQQLIWLIDAHGGPQAAADGWPLATTALGGQADMTVEEGFAVLRLLDAWVDRTHALHNRKAFMLAADRCRPMHTYDPHRGEGDPSGFDAPMYLASRFPRHRTHATPIDGWERQHTMLECFGIEAGIFDQVKVHHLGDSLGDPYQIHILNTHEWLDGEEGPLRNLADAGRGTGQAVIIATELLRTEYSPISLIEHPDAHLSPRAQRALGELVCKIAVQRGSRQRLVIESSGNLLAETVNECADRPDHPLRPEDVSIVAFERDGAEIRLRDAWEDWG